MAKERRIVFGLDDIRAIKITCEHCKQELSHTFQTKCLKKLPDRCPWCNYHWESFGLKKGKLEEFRKFFQEPPLGEAISIQLELYSDDDD